MMTTLSVPGAPRKRRRFSPEFKAQILEACLQQDASVAGVALEHNLNANLVHKWIRKAKQAATSDQPAFIPLSSPQPSVCHSGSSERIRIEIPHRQGTVIVEWPLSDAATCRALLRDLLQ